MIVREWHIMFWRSFHQRMQDIDHLYARLRRKMDGEPEPEDEEHWSMGKHMYMGLMEDVNHRARLVYVGAGILVIGFLFQVLGALPGGVPWTGINSCSELGFGP
jgi:hypothetical protein